MSSSIRINIILGRVKIRKYYHPKAVIMMGTNKIVLSLQINYIRGNVEDQERMSVNFLMGEAPICLREQQAHAMVTHLSNSTRKLLQKWQSATTKVKIQLPYMVAAWMPASWNQFTVLKIEIIQKWHQLRHLLFPQKNPVKSKSTVLTPISMSRWWREALSHRRRSKPRRRECVRCIGRRSPWANPAL